MVSAVARRARTAQASRVSRRGQTKKISGGLDVLVNNAGVFKFVPLEESTEEEFHRQFNTNVLGPMLAVREAVKYFGDKGGSIVNVSAVASISAPPGAVIYSSTKGALDTRTRVLAHELGPRKIRINAVNPGMTATEGTAAIGSSTRPNGVSAKAFPQSIPDQPADARRHRQ